MAADDGQISVWHKTAAVGSLLAGVAAVAGLLVSIIPKTGSAASSENDSRGSTTLARSTDSESRDLAPVNNGTEEGGGDPTMPVYFPSRVDIFFCQNRDATNARLAAQRISHAIWNTPGLKRVAIRPLSETKNAQPDYRMHSNIVRYDPGERRTAEALANMAANASRLDFAAQPTLPGKPSLDYLSVFICA